MILSACSDGEELDSQGDASSQPDTISIASRTSQNTLDSDKVGKHTHMNTHKQSPGVVALKKTTFQYCFISSWDTAQLFCALYHGVTQ